MTVGAGGNTGTSHDIPRPMGRFISAFRDAALRFSRDGCAFLAQSIAFNALFAMFPLTVLVLSAITLVLPSAERRTLLFFDTLAPTLHDYIAANLQTYIYGRGISSLVALVVLLWSGKNLFMGLAYALDRALGVPKGRPLVHNLALSFVMLPVRRRAADRRDRASGVVLGSRAGDRVYRPSAPSRISLAYLDFDRVGIHGHRRALPVASEPAKSPGASRCAARVIVAVAWPAVQYAFAQYVTHVNFTRVYGALSAPLVLLLWFYCIGSIFLFGAEYDVRAPSQIAFR